MAKTSNHIYVSKKTPSYSIRIEKHGKQEELTLRDTSTYIIPSWIGFSLPIWCDHISHVRPMRPQCDKIGLEGLPFPKLKSRIGHTKETIHIEMTLR